MAISGCGGILKWLDFGWGQSLYLVQPYENTMTIFLAWRKKISSHLYRWLPNNLRCYPDPNAFLSTLVNSPMTWKCILLQALKHTVNSMLIQGRHWILVSIGTRFHLCSQAAGSHTVRWSRDGQFCTQRRQHTLVRLWHQHHHWLSLHFCRHRKVSLRFINSLYFFESCNSKLKRYRRCHWLKVIFNF